MKTLAIIPARGGSKRILNKNIRDFNGYPIIKYSIDAAVNSKCFDEIMVSTDDKTIAEIALRYNAKVPFMRSEKNSNDFAVLADVIFEVVEEYRKGGIEFDYVCCILPTAPLIKAEKIIEGFYIIKGGEADSVIPIVRFSYPIQRALKVEEGKIKMIWEENKNKRSQDLMPAYHDIGQFYWIDCRKFMESRSVFMEKCVPIEIGEMDVQDIDTEEDWKIAELKYRLRK